MSRLQFSKFRNNVIMGFKAKLVLISLVVLQTKFTKAGDQGKSLLGKMPLPPPDPADVEAAKKLAPPSDPTDFQPTLHKTSPNSFDYVNSIGSQPTLHQMSSGSFDSTDPMAHRPMLHNLPAASDGMSEPSSAAGSQPRYCYSHGPLLPNSLLPKANKGASSIDVGTVSCEETVGYLLGMNRWYDRKCSNMGTECPSKIRYAVGWFIAAANMVKSRCNLTL
ncbi:uncharacterized protein LOC134223317 [Armigeres subalbatus]|uniref:uncharacterized protein LOC134223317 n=1 Tax=Armigeres subalbatus TaxID=124917 RepID=UPI002ED5D1BF